MRPRPAELCKTDTHCFSSGSFLCQAVQHPLRVASGTGQHACLDGVRYCARCIDLCIVTAVLAIRAGTVLHAAGGCAQAGSGASRIDIEHQQITYIITADPAPHPRMGCCRCFSSPNAHGNSLNSSLRQPCETQTTLQQQCSSEQQGSAGPASSRRQALAAAAALASLAAYTPVQPAQAQQDLDLTITDRVSPRCFDCSCWVKYTFKFHVCMQWSGQCCARVASHLSTPI